MLRYFEIIWCCHSLRKSCHTPSRGGVPCPSFWVSIREWFSLISSCPRVKSFCARTASSPFSDVLSREVSFTHLSLSVLLKTKQSRHLHNLFKHILNSLSSGRRFSMLRTIWHKLNFEMFEILASDHLLLFFIIGPSRVPEGKTNSAEILNLDYYFKSFSIDR